MSWISLAVALALAAVHLVGVRLTLLRSVPRDPLLSLAGGVSVAFVFVHLFPELGARQRALEDLPVLAFLEHHVYLVALVGFGLFYGLESWVRGHSRRGEGSADGAPAGVFWVHVGSFAGYNALVGYLLASREAAGWRSLLSFGLAMALHFVANDHALREHHRRRYRRPGRHLLVAAVLAGFALGAATELPEPALAVLFGFLAGGIVLNVIKEELPEERESRVWAFAAGAAGYAVLLLAI